MMPFAQTRSCFGCGSRATDGATRKSTIADAHAALGCDHLRPGSPGHRTHLSLSPARKSWLMVELAAAETWIGDLASASPHLDEALVSARLAGHRNLVTAGLAHRAVIEYSRGEVQSAATTAQSALDHEDRDQVNEDYSARAHVVLGLSAFNRLDLDAAQKWHEQVESSPVSSTDSVVAAMRMLLRACLMVEAGDLDVARRELGTDPGTVGPLPGFLSRDLCILRYRCAALVADTEAAGQQVAAIRALGYTDDARLLDAMGLIAGMDDASGAQSLESTLEEVPRAHPILRNAVAGIRVAAPHAGRPRVNRQAEPAHSHEPGHSSADTPSAHPSRNRTCLHRIAGRPGSRC